jgi:hypothetical protein
MQQLGTRLERPKRLQEDELGDILGILSPAGEMQREPEHVRRVGLIQRGQPRGGAGILCLHLFIPSGNPAADGFLRSFLDIGMTRDVIKQFAATRGHPIGWFFAPEPQEIPLTASRSAVITCDLWIALVRRRIT